MVILMSYINYANILGISIYIFIHYIDTGDFNALCVCIHRYTYTQTYERYKYFFIKPKYSFFDSWILHTFFGRCDMSKQHLLKEFRIKDVN